MLRKLYEAEYSDGNIEIFSCNRSCDYVLKVARDFGEDSGYGLLLRLFELDENYKKVKKVYSAGLTD